MWFENEGLHDDPGAVGFTGATQRRARNVPRLVCEAFTEVGDALEAGRMRPFIADPGWGHPGGAMASDASTSVGWGIVVRLVVRGTEKRAREATLHDHDGWDWRGGRVRGEGEVADFAQRTASMSDWTIGTLEKSELASLGLLN